MPKHRFLLLNVFEYKSLIRNHVLAVVELRGCNIHGKFDLMSCRHVGKNGRLGQSMQVASYTSAIQLSSWPFQWHQRLSWHPPRLAKPHRSPYRFEVQLSNPTTRFIDGLGFIIVEP